MTISFPCPSCGQTLKAPAQAAGKKVRCPSCQQVVQIPAAAPAQPAQADLSDFFSENLPEAQHSGLDPVQQQAEAFPGFVPGHAPPGDNPYQAPTAAKPVVASDPDKVRQVARSQRNVMFAILFAAGVYISAVIIQQLDLGIGGSIAILSLAIVQAIFACYSAFRMTSALMGTGAAVTFAILQFIPCVSAIALVVVNQMATSFLKGQGYTVGLMGVPGSQIP